MEIEELEAGRGQVPRERRYSDEGLANEVDTDAAALMNDDDISLWDNDAEDAVYRDEFSDSGEEDVFARGDIDDEAVIKGPVKPR